VTIPFYFTFIIFFYTFFYLYFLYITHLLFYSILLNIIVTNNLLVWHLICDPSPLLTLAQNLQKNHAPLPLIQRSCREFRSFRGLYLDFCVARLYAPGAQFFCYRWSHRSYRTILRLSEPLSFQALLINILWHAHSLGRGDPTGKCVASCPWLKTFLRRSSPILSNICPCDLLIVIAKTNLIRNCLLKKVKGYFTI
jgi:hypothetical protein